MKYEIITDLNNSDIFNIAHNFTSLKGSEFNPIEIDFLFAFISQIDKDDEEFKEYQIDSYILSDKMQRRMKKDRVAKLFDSLIGKFISVSTKDDEKRYSIFDTLSFNKKDEIYKVKFSSEMKTFFLKLQPYTKGYLSDIFKIESTYSKKIYLLCSQWKRAGSFKIKVEKLMKDLGIQEGSSYLKYGLFKDKVLKVAERNMINKTSIYFEYEELKRGRKVDELLFIIKDNPKFIKPKENKTPKLFEPGTSKFEKYKGKIIETKSGDKEINFIEEQSDQLKIYFMDDGFAIIKNIDILNEIIKDIR
jgi:plasmid replication initiation protein